MFKVLSGLISVLAFSGPLHAEDKQTNPALVAQGEKVFRKCKSCHQIGAAAQNRTGPALINVVGATAGQATGYRYSKAMRAAGLDGLVWTPNELVNFLASPKAYIKGTKMKFPGLRKPQDIKAVIAYLGASKG